MKGTGVIKVLKEKGFGFITPDDGGDDLFFHASQVKNVKFNMLVMGSKVEFKEVSSDKGRVAQEINVETD